MKNYILFLSLLLLAACGGKEQAESQGRESTTGNVVELSPEQAKNAGITTGKAEHKQVSSVLKVNGVIDVPPQNMVSISAALGGYLKSSQLLPGMHVNKGEVIAVMEDPQYIQTQQDYLIAKAKLTYTETEYKRQKELNQSKASSDKSFQQAETEYMSEKIVLKSLYEKLKLIGINPENLNETTISRSINITSPIDGYVSKVNVNIGKYVSPTEVLFDIVNPTDIHLALTVFEKDVDKLYSGQKVIAYTNNNPDKKYNCEIILIGQDITRERNVVVHCHFEQYDKTLIPGMFMNAEIELKNNNALTVPEEAVVSYEGKQFLFTALPGNHFEMTEVKTGSTENGVIEIINADQIPDKNIVLKGAYSLLMKMKNTED
jgi:cobalt-zinc-cadmium efflux system membrane fusion protein